MPDWSASMRQTYEHFVVDPATWMDKKIIKTVKSATISRDAEAETLGSATIDVTESLGESYIRSYLITNQNEIDEKHPLGTVLVQTPSISFDGKIRTVSMDAYTPLLELKEKIPPIGYFTPKGENIMNAAYNIVADNVRAPVVKPDCSDVLEYNFVANSDDTWLTYVSDLIANAKYRLDLDEMGRILFVPKQDTASLQPVWTYTDDNSSILHTDISLDHDLYGVPNVVEVIYSNGGDHFISKVVNDDPNSPTSVINRGREIPHRVTDPELYGTATQNQIDEYAKNLLKELSNVEYTITYTHAYCPVRIGDCVRLNQSSFGLTDVKARVINQSIRCEPGCPVSETAVFTKKVWG